jgi:hypothetical protein
MLESELLGEGDWSGCVEGRCAAWVCSCRRREASAPGLAIGKDLWAKSGFVGLAHISGQYSGDA